MSRTDHQNTILAICIDWMAAFYEAQASLLRHPQRIDRHAVRESLWYAAGLLAKHDSARVPRALLIIDTVLGLQFDEPEAPWHGTWPRAPEEPLPQTNAVIWRDYDPNWRQFIGCLLGVLVADFAATLGSARCDRARTAIDRALRGEPPGRITAGYSNIALLHAWLSSEYGDRAAGERLAGAIESLYRAESGFREFNSPTYYGVDLWGLALWRRSTSPHLAAAGQRLEADLWRDICDFYHAGLRNLCGPYDRAYGMDMTRYAALLGLWLWWGCGDATRAFPDTAQPFGHAHDFCATPLLALAPPLIPEDAGAVLTRGLANRDIERRMPNRIITASLRRELMLGAANPAQPDPTGQAAPITAHWFDATGAVAWLCIRGALAGTVSDAAVALHSEGELMLECSASAANTLRERVWQIGDRRIDVTGIEVATPELRSGRQRAGLVLPSGAGRLLLG